MKARGAFIPMVTAYDYNQAMLVDEAGVTAILVGDSLGNVVLGYESTVPVTMDDMVRATAAVSRGAKHAFIIGDMPFGSYQSDIPTAIRNAIRLMKEGGAQAVKLEGGVSVEKTIRALVEAGMPVMGHVGFTPQSIHSFGGYRVQGRGENAQRVVEDALAVERAGAFSVVLELMPSELSKEITEQLSIPTIGIGAGPHCDGQVQVLHDMLGLDPTFRPRHAGHYGDFAGEITNAVMRYVEDVCEGKFPGDAEAHYSRPS
jgi:3-methyl-2-oxobutanoate hydroxymethyltransferase